MECRFYRTCWRRAYSRFLMDRGYDIPPNRMVMFSNGYAITEMLPYKGIYAENMPLIRDGEYINICPNLRNLPIEQCYEYQKEKHRLEKLEAARRKKQSNPQARPRVWIPKEILVAVAKRDHYKCVYCNRAQNQIWNGRAIRCHVDHFVPLAMGGHETDPSNLVFACQDCNQAKKDSLWEKGCRIGWYDAL